MSTDTLEATIERLEQENLQLKAALRYLDLNGVTLAVPPRTLAAAVREIITRIGAQAFTSKQVRDVIQTDERYQRFRYANQDMVSHCLATLRRHQPQFGLKMVRRHVGRSPALYVRRIDL